MAIMTIGLVLLAWTVLSLPVGLATGWLLGRGQRTRPLEVRAHRPSAVRPPLAG